MSTAAELVERVRAATEGTPYTVTETPEGFEVGIDIVDARWYTLLYRNGVKRVFTYEVRLDEAKQTMAVTDVARSVRWSAGGDPTRPPSLHAEKSIQRGRVYPFSTEKQFGVDAGTGQAGMPVDYTFSSEEGRRLIRGAAKELGWSEKLGGEAKGAIIFGVAVLAALVVAGIVLGIVALLG